MEEKAGIQISRKAFIQSLLILLALIVVTGILTQVIPSGQYERSIVDGREVIDPQSFQYTARPDYQVWRWFIAPLEVLTGPDGTTIIVLAVFILLVGVAFGLLDKSGILKAVISQIVAKMGGRKYLLLAIITLFFMLLGAFFGIFEETIPLIPVMIALSFLLGWDTLTGLGMSILATNMGFSAAISNPFTIGLAQKIAGLPIFSGAWFRIPVFIVIYLVTIFFLIRYAKTIEREPERSPVYQEDQKQRAHYKNIQIDAPAANMPRMKNAILFFAIMMVLILAVLVMGPVSPVISELSLPLVGLLFFIAGVGSNLIAGVGFKDLMKSAGEGVSGIAPGIPLILMAASVKFIAAQGGIMDTILYSASGTFSSASPFLAALLIFGLALAVEFLIGSASAKVFLLMPILFPLGDLVGVTRQVAVTAYCFGDGFTNMIYPTNAVLLIALSLSSVTYGKWIKWSMKLWGWVLPITIIFLAIAVAINLGPF